VNQVRFSWKRKPSQASAEALRRVVVATLDEMRHSRSEVHILITGDSQIRELNRQYRSKDVTTDVLSFPDGDQLPSGSVLLGEIIISIDTARRQAEQAEITELQELKELVLHGTLHLLGYNHSKDDGAMNALELKLREDVLH